MYECRQIPHYTFGKYIKYIWQHLIAKFLKILHRLLLKQSNVLFLHIPSL